jgi:hypothetical protein
VKTPNDALDRVLGRYSGLRMQGLGHTHALDVLCREYGLTHIRHKVEALVDRNVKELDLW